MNVGTAGSSFEASASFHAHGRAKNLFLFCREKPLGALAAILLLVLVLAASFAETLATHNRVGPMRSTRWLVPITSTGSGTDNLGRDIYSRIIYGARISLAVGIASTLLGAVFGGIIGVISGYFGGWFDLMTQRMMDILQGLPLLILALVMAAALGPSIGNVIVAISVPIIPRAQRVIRGSVIVIREFAYIEAARALGAQTFENSFSSCAAKYDRSFHRVDDRSVRRRDPRRGCVEFLGTRCSRTLSLVGQNAFRLGGRICPEGAVACPFPWNRDQPGGFCLESSRRCCPRQTRPATTRSVKAKQSNRKGLSKKVSAGYCDRRCPAVMTHASILKQERKKATR